MSETDRLLENAQAYAAGFDKGDLPAPPAMKIAVLTCMDARIDPSALLGLEEGDAHVIRNTGGVVSDGAIRSLSISQCLLGTEEVVLIQHTRCGMLEFTDAELADRVEAETGVRPNWSPEAFTDLDRSVRDGVELIESSPLIPRKDSIRGFVYEVETGALREVAP